MTTKRLAISELAFRFDLARGETTKQNDEIFINDRRFRYLPDYEDAKIRQRHRMKSLGFKPTRLDNIGDKGRIKKNDRLMSRPEGFDREMLREIVGQNNYGNAVIEESVYWCLGVLPASARGLLLCYKIKYG